MGLFSFFKKNVQKFPSKKVEKVINNAVKFLEKSPTHNLPLLGKFSGCGVYVLYYYGTFYDEIVDKDLKLYFSKHPIYVGKAVPTGWRNGRISKEKSSSNLWKRVSEHSGNISKISNLNIGDFCCKYIILDKDLISPVEARLIRLYNPIWNCTLDGFGNHHPGETRFNQAKPDWDVLHPGREWADNMNPGNDREEIINRLRIFLGDE